MLRLLCAFGLRRAMLVIIVLLLFPNQTQAASRTGRLLSSLSPEEKVGQLFMVWFQGPSLSDDLVRLIRDRHIGGCILYTAAGNVTSPEQVARLTAALQHEAAGTAHGLGLLIGIDQEGGPVARLRQGVTLFPSQMAQAATGRVDLVRQAATITGQELLALGINVDFTPVADVNINPANPIIGIRSFGSNPGQVARLTAAAVSGYDTAGIICTPKHFPGHGDTAVDSHVGLPTVTHDAATLSRVDFPPFRAAFAAKAPAVMTAHVLAPALIPDGVPATLCRRMLEGVLRGRLGFDGVIFTDSLGMGAVANQYGTAEAAVRALAAGADILLVGADAGRSPAERLEAMDHVLAAVRQGRISMARLDAAVSRILRLKERYGLLDASLHATMPARLEQRVGTPAHLAVAQRIAQRALTAISFKRGCLPLPATAETVVIRPKTGRDARDGEAEAAIATWEGVRTIFPVADPDEAAIAAVLAQVGQARHIVYLSTDARRKPGQCRLAEALAAAAPDRLLIVAAQSPYDLPLLPKVPVRLATYGETPVGLQALRKGLFTPFRFTGQCPAELGQAKP